MGQATNLLLRQRIFELRQQGVTIQAIAEQLALSFSTVKSLCRRFRETGSAGLQPDYSNCGSKTANRLAGRKGQAIGQKTLHPKWGAPRIRVEIHLIGSPAEGALGPTGEPPGIRTLQRWYRKSGLYSPRRQGTGPITGRSTATHNIWEVDAKENLFLTDGSPACYLTIGDEKSGAWIEAPVFPPPKNQSGPAGRSAKGIGQSI